ncbi:MAG: HlyC/CorC family transporter [Pseudomonas sp.]
MDNLPIGPMLGVLVLLILWSGLLTAVESAHHQLKATRRGSRNTGSHTLKLTFKLGSLVLSNALIKVLIVVMSTLLAVDFWHLRGPVLACIVVGSLLLIFAEFIPRALAARYPDPILMLGNSLLTLPMKAVYPLSWLFSAIADALLRPFGVTDKPRVRPDEDEVPLAVILQDNHLDSSNHSHVMSGIHALDSITVNDILVPRSEVDGINLDDSIESIIEQLIMSRHTRLPVYHDDINQVEGVLNTRQISHLLPRSELTIEDLKGACYEPYFVPESTPLQLQLLNFHKQQRRLGIVVDEYGEVQGIVSLEDILEEIVGEFESEQDLDNPHIHPQADGRLVVDGAATIRELNKTLGWHLPSDGPKTLNGLVTEALETIPESSVCLKIGPYRLEILETEDNRVTRVMMWHYNMAIAVV